LRDGAKLIAVLFGDDNEPTGPAGDRVGEATGQVIMVAAAVLILDDKLAPIFNLGHDVDPSSSRGLYLGLTSRGQVDTNGRAELVEPVNQQRREVGRLALPRVGQSPVAEISHSRHALLFSTFVVGPYGHCPQVG